VWDEPYIDTMITEVEHQAVIGKNAMQPPLPNRLPAILHAVLNDSTTSPMILFDRFILLYFSTDVKSVEEIEVGTKSMLVRRFWEQGNGVLYRDCGRDGGAISLILDRLKVLKLTDKDHNSLFALLKVSYLL
jgi:hypothetical protein